MKNDYYFILYIYSFSFYIYTENIISHRHHHCTHTHTLRMHTKCASRKNWNDNTAKPTNSVDWIGFVWSKGNYEHISVNCMVKWIVDVVSMFSGNVTFCRCPPFVLRTSVYFVSMSAGHQCVWSQFSLVWVLILFFLFSISILHRTEIHQSDFAYIFFIYTDLTAYNLQICWRKKIDR